MISSGRDEWLAAKAASMEHPGSGILDCCTFGAMFMKYKAAFQLLAMAYLNNTQRFVPPNPHLSAGSTAHPILRYCNTHVI
jgi:hypothetical protein